MENILGQRLRSARQMQKLSMDALCLRMENKVSKQSISKYEKGKMMPDSTILIAISNALSLPVDYFFKPYKFEFPDVEFRKNASLSEKRTQSIKEQVRDSLERYYEIEEILEVNNKFDIDFSNVVIQSVDDVITQAVRLREILKLGEDGISNVVSVLEDNNIKIIEVDEDSKFSGMSGYIKGYNPIIVLNKNLTPERFRFTALHELAHLLLKFDPIYEQKEIEKFCNIFANEMLISSKRFIKIIQASRKAISIQELIPIQQQYGISIDALMYKAKELNVITKNRHQHYCIKKNADPRLKKAVEESRIPKESTVRFVTLVCRALANEHISVSKASVLLGKSINEVRSINYI